MASTLKPNMTAKKDIMRIGREAVIKTMKPKLIAGLANLLEDDIDKEFLLLCKRVEAIVRAWYLLQFEELMQLYAWFDPLNGATKLEQQKFSPSQVDKFELRFLEILFQVLAKSNFKILSDDEVEVANSGQYLLNLPITVNVSQLDTKLFTTYFNSFPISHVPKYANQYVIFRRGIGIDKTTDYFIMQKLDVLVSRLWTWLLKKCRLSKSSSTIPDHAQNAADLNEEIEPFNSLGRSNSNSDLYVERIRIQNMKLSIGTLLKRTTVQEPTFDRMILVYRKSTPRKYPSVLGDRAIHIKHFKNIPMADMELVLPEKKNPSLTPMDWIKFLISAFIGLVAFSGTLESHPADIWVALAILGGFVGYCAKIYFTFQANLVEYQNLITRSMYDKQLDSGKGTLLHLCDDVIQQEIKEVIIAYFILMTKGKATLHLACVKLQDLDFLCEQLLFEEFQENCDFDVTDAVQKLERLGIVTKDSLGRYCHQSLRKANDIIGVTTDELVETTQLQYQD
ncbi:hypothetical protein O6H91_10G065000 [Diphasiastrum complanatum]|uniref:Uncharacterized protein n=1 Tax=Diphasiastrum complanatum TaxID=34168 RepID=A0ACC2CHT1_DIPCM|nr:hypothetical protein O6H91_10G065000 [Diphasiastrum complanatum]